jgi:hypothetical protein
VNNFSEFPGLATLPTKPEHHYVYDNAGRYEVEYVATKLPVPAGDAEECRWTKKCQEDDYNDFVTF